MAEVSTRDVREFLSQIQGQRVTLKELRAELNILPGTKSFDLIRSIIFQLAEQKIVRSLGIRGEYKVITQVEPVPVFAEALPPPAIVMFPRDLDTHFEMDFAEDIVLRQGDLILLAGRSNFGKTALCMNFCAENIDQHPVLMGNEYTTIDNKPSPRFLLRIENMDWVKWRDESGRAKFTLLPVRADYAEHIVKDRINIIDWINIDTGEHFLIGPIMEAIKRELGKGIGIIAIQKAEGAESGRGGQFTKDFCDCELLLDKFGETDDVLLTIGKIKEPKRRVVGRTFVYGISQGVKIINFREVVKCKSCWGKGWKLNKPCEDCSKSGYINKEKHGQ
mgnify:CR=1 FL=1